jgi:hypothetical protein
MSANLRIVGAAPTAPLDISRQVQLLQAQARTLAREHVSALESALTQVAAMSAEIAAGGEAYPPGVREVARRLAEDTAARHRTLEAIRAKT